jgi:hypothetical protein
MLARQASNTGLNVNGGKSNKGGALLGEVSRGDQPGADFQIAVFLSSHVFVPFRGGNSLATCSADRFPVYLPRRITRRFKIVNYRSTINPLPTPFFSTE